jgi:hypothetical protein
MKKEKINLKAIRNQNAKKLEELLSNPKKIEKLAKEQYGDRWKVVYAGERHYMNSQLKSKKK